MYYSKLQMKTIQAETTQGSIPVSASFSQRDEETIALGFGLLSRKPGPRLLAGNGSGSGLKPNICLSHSPHHHTLDTGTTTDIKDCLTFR
jgi:hypothetical protein